ncbi:MAG: YbaK/EbsC family protein, partial [Allobaculum sp.]
DIVVGCEGCDFSSNEEITEVVDTMTDDLSEELPMEKIFTPNAGTIEEVSSFLGKEPSDFVKTLIYNADGQLVAFVLPGDRELNETKAGKLLNAVELNLADAEEVKKATGARIGFAGPVGLNIPVYMDRQVAHKKNFIIGANEDDHHLKNVNLKDFTPTAVADLTQVKEGDLCPKCGKKLTFEHGIEVGNLFKLGTKYSKAMNLYFSDQNNQLQPVWMGSYGIGLERCMAAVADQYHDDNGLMWPDALAPFRVAIVIVNMKDEKQVEEARKLYDYCTKQGMDVLLDDRTERAGVKFKDMELIGIPHRFTFGKGVANGKVEYVQRKNGEKVEVAIEDLPELLNKIYER